MFEIHRIWPYVDTENNDKIALFSCPCVSIHVDDYIREEFDGLKPKIDWSVAESFPFPASFEEQRYIGDEGKIHVHS